jgi:hypothetical protein
MDPLFFDFPTHGSELGFSAQKTGGHMARSMMFNELRLLLQAPNVHSLQDIRRAVQEENVLGKPTFSSRKKSYEHLVQLYGLQTSAALFRVLVQFASSSLEPLALMALVCVYCRDPQLRGSFTLIEETPPGSVLTRKAMEDRLEELFPKRFSAAMKQSLAQNVNTTWTASGHLQGRAVKTRCLPTAHFLATTYALFAAYLTGLRGEFLLKSVFARLVGVTPVQAIDHLKEATRHSLLRIRHGGGVSEIDFSPLLTEAERTFFNGTP